MKRLAIAAVGLALVVAVVFAVWASVDEAPWEPTASTTSPRRVWVTQEGAPRTVCDVARDAFAEAEVWTAAFAKGLEEKPEAAESLMLASQSFRQERLLALQLINEACP